MEITSELVSAIQSNLTPDLLRPEYRKLNQGNPMFGHCYVASEVLFHLAGGKTSGLKIKQGRDDSVEQGYICYPALQTIRFYDSEGFECFRGLSEALMPMPYDEPIPLEITEGDAQICRLKNPKISEFLLPLLEAGRKFFNLNN